MSKSKIEWTHRSWNPVTGCTKVSTGCDHCYAERLSERFRGVKGNAYEMGFDLTLRPERLDQPKSWKKPQRVFVNSMSDLFHKDIPEDYILRVFLTMEQASWHNYQILTKRSPVMRKFVKKHYPGGVPAHIWLGVSVENQQALVRMLHLQNTPRQPEGVHFVSFEPLLEHLGPIDLYGIQWAIVGGESGPGARPIGPDWVRSLRDQCLMQKVAFFFKQWGGRFSKAGSNTLDGEQWLAYPKELPDY